MSDIIEKFRQESQQTLPASSAPLLPELQNTIAGVTEGMPLSLAARQAGVLDVSLAAWVRIAESTENVFTVWLRLCNAAFAECVQLGMKTALETRHWPNGDIAWRKAMDWAADQNARWQRDLGKLRKLCNVSHRTVELQRAQTQQVTRLLLETSNVAGFNMLQHV